MALQLRPGMNGARSKHDLFVYFPRGLECGFIEEAEFESNKKALSQCGLAKYDINSFGYQLKKAITVHKKERPIK